MSPAVRERERRPAVELALRFGHDPEVTTRRLQPGNDHLWTGLHRDDIATIYGEHPAAVQIAVSHNRSEILDAPDPLQEAEHALCTAHLALIDHQSAPARRRELAGEFGELGGVLIGTLAGAGGSENDASGASVHEVTCAEGRGGSGS
jgi:hypothetical protein